MSNFALRVEELGKRYRKGAALAPYQTFREAVVHTAGAPLRNLRRLRSLSSSSAVTDATVVWALRDVSFDVPEGTVLGVIGRNGAGKSTLLKILSRITRPTTGRATIYGRVGSLLEVGTGFHPELTGRDNVYLNGSILGMDRVYIEQRFEEIVEFAGVQQFIDTPVKRYSSGMYLRLAFAVAAHLEPEVLVVDEVLAVGDAEFQKKCIGKMGEVAQGGRTVLFVSHNMAAVQNLCDYAILLQDGHMVEQGDVAPVVQRYLAASAEAAHTALDVRQDRRGSGDLMFQSVSLHNERDERVESFAAGETAKIILYCDNRTTECLRNVRVSIGIDNAVGQRITVLSSDLAGDTLAALPPGRHRIDVEIARLPLAPGRYGYTLFAAHNDVPADWIQNAGSFDVEAGDFFGTGRLPPLAQGDFLLSCRFTRVE